MGRGKWSTVAIVLLMISSVVSAREYQNKIERSYLLLPIIGVYDGDTIYTEFTQLPVPLNDIRVRIRDIDAPEMPAPSYLTTGRLGRASCVQEAELALKAKAAVEDLLSGSNVIQVRNFAWDKFGGRVTANVFVKGKNVGEELIRAGLAVPYDGGTKTHSWCD